MVKKLFSWFLTPLGGIAILIFALILLSGAVWGISQAQASPEQPIQFPHKRHVALGIQCLYCHPGAWRGPAAGLPTQTKCWGCHQQLQITKTSEKLKPLVQAVENNQPLKWVPVVTVPDFVQFNHRPHIAAGVNCEDCHGDMSKVDIAQNPQTFNMGFCLNCHKQHSQDNPELRTKLTDCGTCHY
jgi:hypothetical protein